MGLKAETPEAPVPFKFQHGKDYEIEWQIPGVHRKPRYSRMGFVSASGSRILFDARGPNRSTDGQYGGTAEIDRNWMKSIKEVNRNLELRYAVRT